jgi:hypothetical protein
MVFTNSHNFLWHLGLGDPRLAYSKYALSDLGSRSFPLRRFFDVGRMLESTNSVGNSVCKLLRTRIQSEFVYPGRLRPGNWV